MNTRSGYVKFFRETISDPLIAKDPEYLALWVYLLCSAAYEPTPALLGGQRIVLSPGQLTVGRRQLAANSGISESKVQRILNAFESAHLIEQKTTNKNRLISILSWSDQFLGEHQNEQQEDNGRTTGEQQANTLEEFKKRRKEEKRRVDADKPPRTRFVPPTLEEVQSYVSERHSNVDPQGFIDFYEAKGWMVGKTPMKDWKAACRNAEAWERWNKGAKEQKEPYKWVAGDNTGSL